MKKIKVDRFKLSKENRAKYEKLLSTHLKEQKAKKDAVRKEKETAAAAVTTTATTKRK